MSIIMLCFPLILITQGPALFHVGYFFVTDRKAVIFFSWTCCHPFPVFSCFLGFGSLMEATISRPCHTIFSNTLNNDSVENIHFFHILIPFNIVLTETFTDCGMGHILRAGSLLFPN